MAYQQLILENGGTGAWVLLSWLPLGLIVALVVGGLLAANKPVPPLVLTAVLALPGFVGLVLGLDASMSMDQIIAIPDETAKFSPLSLHLARHLVTDLLPGWLVALPAAVVIFSAAITGVARGPRRLLLPLAVLALSAGLTAMPLVGATTTQAPLGEPLVRAILYGVLGLGVSGALLSRNPDSAGPSAGATAAMALPLVVGGLELASMARGYLQVLDALAQSATGSSSLLLQGIDSVAAQRPCAWAALGLSTLIALAGVLGGLDRSPRSTAMLGGLALALVPALALFFDGYQPMLLLNLSMGG